MSYLGASPYTSAGTSPYQSVTYHEAPAPPSKNIIFGRVQYGESFAIHNPARFGKTLLAVFIIIERLLTEPWLDGIISNIHFNLSNVEGKYNLQHKYIPLTDIEMFKDLQGRHLVFIDELRRYADSRIPQSSQNRFTSNLLADLGKQKTDFYYTDQKATAVDTRIRENVNFVLAPYYNEQTGWLITLVFRSFEDLFNYGWTGKYLHKYAFWAPPYFKYYETGQKIEDYTQRFHPDRFGKPFLEWYEKQPVKQPISKKLVRYWSNTTGQMLHVGEIPDVLTWLELQKDLGLEFKK